MFLKMKNLNLRPATMNLRQEKERNMIHRHNKDILNRMAVVQALRSTIKRNVMKQKKLSITMKSTIQMKRVGKKFYF